MSKNFLETDSVDWQEQADQHLFKRHYTEAASIYEQSSVGPVNETQQLQDGPAPAEAGVGFHSRAQPTFLSRSRHYQNISK